MPAESSHPVLILAAGEGRRVGGPKVLLDVAGKTALARILAGCAAGGFSPVTAVVPPALQHEVGQRHPEIASVLVNPRPETGPLGSLHIGMESVKRSAAGLLMCMVDFCLVSDATMRALGAAVRRDPTRLWRPVHEGRHGHPVWFPMELFGALKGAPMDQGARVVVYARRDLWSDVLVSDPWIHRDLDTPLDLAAFRAQAEGES